MSISTLPLHPHTGMLPSASAVTDARSGPSRAARAKAATPPAGDPSTPPAGAPSLSPNTDPTTPPTPDPGAEQQLAEATTRAQ
ncbi:hypothetical protein [Streptomyces sp. NPDC046727]|uniref:hypothetical protein n=1 Tax=Streptomyces sp. NPDC046727 TaxID=3155373 RepID=UPI0033E4FF2C